MELSSPIADAPSTATRRKSGRVSKKPETFGAPVKRKRNEAGGDDDVDDDDASDAESSGESESEPDEEEMKERRRRARKSNAAKPKAPAKKKAKAVNGEALSLAIRPAKSAPKRRKQRQAITDAETAGGLYGKYCLL
jgi:cohesin complex subunit SA-1/2